FGETRAQWVVSVCEKLNRYEEADELLACAERSVDPSTRAEGRMAIWHACLESEGRIDCEALCFARQRVPSRRGSHCYLLPPTKIPFSYAYGAGESISRTYQPLTTHVTARGLRLAAAKREVYWPTAGSGDSGSLTEVQFPISKARGSPRAA